MFRKIKNVLAYCCIFLFILWQKGVFQMLNGLSVKVMFRKNKKCFSILLHLLIYSMAEGCGLQDTRGITSDLPILLEEYWIFHRGSGVCWCMILFLYPYGLHSLSKFFCMFCVFLFFLLVDDLLKRKGKGCRVTRYNCNMILYKIFNILCWRCMCNIVSITSDLPILLEEY
jgi:hypothetical protein